MKGRHEVRVFMVGTACPVCPGILSHIGSDANNAPFSEYYRCSACGRTSNEKGPGEVPTLEYERVSSYEDPWANDNVQFVRLLGELNAAGALDVPEVIDAVCASMDLLPAQVRELMDRAESVWERVKDDFASRARKPPT